MRNVSRPIVVVLAGLAIATAWTAQANFGSAAGFSGRNGGVTCIACHAPPNPVNNDAKAVLTGLPATWNVGGAYPLTLRVEGGPAAMPDPQAQGGFDIAADGGSFAIESAQAHPCSPEGSATVIAVEASPPFPAPGSFPAAAQSARRRPARLPAPRARRAPRRGPRWEH